MDNSFELGPIRPPSEAQSILIRVTRNCPWNKCAFCNTYKDKKFSRRKVDEVISDIDSIYTISQRILQAMHSLNKNTIDAEVIKKAHADDETTENFYQQVVFWLRCGMNSLFLQDANSLILKTSELVEILNHIKSRFPSLQRITTYARAKTVSKKSPEELSEIRRAGLSRIHIGFESGSDRVLEFIKKGVTAKEHIDAGKKAIAAGFELSEYYMPGLGGSEFLEENARESAHVINEINPSFIRIRSTIPLPGTPLSDAMASGNWTPTTEEERVKDLRIFIENLDGIESIIQSDHMMNLLEEIDGKIPDDKEFMIQTIDRFMSMEKDDKENFIIGKRLGYFKKISDYKKSDELSTITDQLKERFGTVDKGIVEMLKNFI